MQLLKSAPFHLIPDNRDFRGVAPDHLVEPRDGEQQVLERIQGEVFRRGAWSCGWEEVQCEREGEVGRALR